ncbi:sulfatase-like hydrolase/transferase [Acidipila sp. EB88]|uniref:sulfatase-like hydrolase/transferase n=1 Tax=Acidipila sp. EB88 TaxID=2305226 RepID=UPI000F5DCA7C|nr:sulfatase-like hydrolase/transferase [Acidipila sp. EB88]RRA48311.1 hypothetical protein D1Y84_08445 [Acidipila sp. EB88]
MSLFERSSVAAFGATAAIQLYMLAPFASPTHAAFYHLHVSVAAVLASILGYFLGIWLLLWVLLSVTRRSPLLHTLLLLELVLLVCWKLASAWWYLRSFGVPFAAKAAFVVVALIASASFLLAGRGAPRRVLQVRRFCATLIGFFALSGALLLAEILLFSFQARKLNDSISLHHGPTQPAGHRGRIVWIVLDELSYRQVYEHRFPGLLLPTFDRLARESLVFTDARPAGDQTQLVLPAYITGIPVDALKVQSAQPLPLLHNARTGRWALLDPHDTAFQDALDAGDRTAVAGWYNPYCRLLPSVLDKCYWQSRNSLPGGISADAGLRWNLEQYFERWKQSFHTRPGHDAEHLDVEEPGAAHEQDYADLVTHGDLLLKDPSITFMLLHMPIPHPGGIYDRHTTSFTSGRATYLDNLALCDQYLAHVRTMLEQNHTWGDTTLVIMGDHSWRTNTIWSHTPQWTPEEQAASGGGRFDDRPFYLVRLPHDSKGGREDAPFATLRTRALFDALMRGHVETQSQLDQWVRQGQ